MYWLAKTEDRQIRSTLHRFDPAFWTVNFPRPMMASLVTEGADGLVLRCVFYRRSDLAGLIWTSADRLDHPLIGYETDRDYRGLSLDFRWRSSGLMPLDAISGPTLTIEGRDREGQARTWYVRLWNYAEGSSTDAHIRLDFDRLDGGFLLPEEADPVYPGDIDRLFVSAIAPAFSPGDDTPLDQPVEATVRISALRVAGSRIVLEQGDTVVKPHGLALATGYDDIFSQTPERALRTFRHLGYRGAFNIYVGMSHYFHLSWEPATGRFVVDPSRPLNHTTAAWFDDLFQRADAWGVSTIASISYELFWDHAPEAWAQRDHNGHPALTGWEPPSTLVAPTNVAAIAYLGDVMLAFADAQAAAGLPVRVQIGEPWWWSGLGGDRVPTFYDAATTSLYTAETGRPVPPAHRQVTEIPSPDQIDYLDWLGEKLAQSTAMLAQRVRDRHPGAEILMLFYTPQVLDATAPMLERVNMPVGWAAPAFDRLQLEDYTHVIAGDWSARSRGLDRALSRLGYDRAQTDYFAGFALNAEDAALWARIDRAADLARAEGYHQVFIWAHPQVARDGYVHFAIPEGEEAMEGFHDVRLPATISFGSTGGPGFATTVVETGSGYEQRTIQWAEARAEYDLAPAVQHESEVTTLLAFFRARQGRAFAFRFRDWTDFRSGPADLAPTPFDQVLGTGDGQTTRFHLIKRYDDPAAPALRRITKPVADSVNVALDGTVLTTGWQPDPLTGTVDFDLAPSAGSQITAGFEFDVPVRFADDRLSLGLQSFRAGLVEAIRLVEVREVD